MLSSCQVRESRQSVCVGVVFAFVRQHRQAVKLYEESEFVFAERWLSCRNPTVLSSFQARESGQCLCVCVCLGLRL